MVGAQREDGFGKAEVIDAIGEAIFQGIEFNLPTKRFT